ncbi:DUF1330 domain-containing protein [Lutimonas saemankumensis]|uniref:DUF1330 domain-containing protein n=1 Tax=Lutimonas saemankumensis TaxID=483016 RepID=UPI001CD78175|nr:DUF1330 domain-containing protein [Lutimonas saemankumensis]MCA0933622.1 DUF1330 domain-containing protein [Lutimonas saemankumensis]
MAAFVLVEIDIHDKELYKSYTLLTPATIAAYDGKFVVRGGEISVLEGEWNPERIVLLEFPSVEKANEWWHSEAYEKVRKIRQKAATTKMIVLKGVSDQYD